MSQDHLEECNYSDEEDELVSFQIGTNKLTISYSQLCKYSQHIRNSNTFVGVKEHLEQEICNFQRKHQIKNDSVIIFFQSFQSKNINITFDNIKDLLKLSKFFGTKYIQKKLENFCNLHANEIDYIIQNFFDEFTPDKKMKKNIHSQKKLSNY